jgi:hypothetical protein
MGIERIFSGDEVLWRRLTLEPMRMRQFVAQLADSRRPCCPYRPLELGAQLDFDWHASAAEDDHLVSCITW